MSEKANLARFLDFITAFEKSDYETQTIYVERIQRLADQRPDVPQYREMADAMSKMRANAHPDRKDAA